MVAPKKLPTLTTDTISTITQNTAICGGNITSDNGLEVSARGICWSLKPNPTIKDTLTKDAAGTGKFKSQLTNLVPDTTYFVRAYATNSDGTAYGLQVTFRTTKAVFPILTTTKATEVNDLSATSGGNVVFNGGTPVIQRGVCWGTNTFPTILDNKTTDGLGNGNFTSSISGLTAGTTYYIRSYATNKTGTGYGNQDTITTLTIPTLTTVTAQATSQTTASSGGNITNDGGTAVTARGICWNTTGNPTINDTKTTDGNGAGNFTSTLTNLTADVIYYIRAYATNKIGTAYGNIISVKTTKFPTNGLVAWYPFNGNTNDESGNGNNGTVNGATLTNDRNGIPNKAYLFNGISNTIDFSNPFLGGVQNSAFTFHTAIKFNSLLNSPNIWGKTFFWGEVNFFVDNNGAVQFIWANSVTGNKYSYVSSQKNIITNGIWYNIDVKFNNSIAQIYINSIPVSTLLSWVQQGGAVLSTSQIDSQCNFAQISGSSKIGLRYSGGIAGNYFNGTIDEFGIWNRALTQEEITNLYNFK